MTDARTQLREAHDARLEARQREADAEQAVHRARELLQGAESSLARLGDIDKRITEHRAAQFKELALAGRADSGFSIDPPEDLKIAKERQQKAKDRVDACRVAHSDLRTEHEKTLKQLARADNAVRAAAVEVAKSEAELLAIELLDIKERAYELNLTIEGLTALAIPAENGGSVRASSTVIHAALNWQPPQTVVSASPRASAIKAWRHYLNRLFDDYDATFESETADIRKAANLHAPIAAQ